MFRVMSQHTFKKWKPGVWQAMNTGLYTLDKEEDEDKENQGICHPTVVGEHHSLSEYSVSFPQVFDSYRCFFTIFQVNKKSLIKQLFKHTFKNLFC